MNIASATASGAPARDIAPSSGPMGREAAFPAECIFQLAELGSFEPTPAPAPAPASVFASTLAGQSELNASIMSTPSAPSAGQAAPAESEQAEPQPVAPVLPVLLAQLAAPVAAPEVPMTAPRSAAEGPAPRAPRSRRPTAEAVTTVAPQSPALPLLTVQAPVQSELPKAPPPVEALASHDTPRGTAPLPAINIASTRPSMTDLGEQPAAAAQPATQPESPKGFNLRPSPNVAAAFILATAPRAVRASRPVARPLPSDRVEGEPTDTQVPNDRSAPVDPELAFAVGAESQKPVTPAPPASTALPPSPAPAAQSKAPAPPEPSPTPARQSVPPQADPSAPASRSQAPEPETAFAARICESTPEPPRRAETQPSPMPLKAPAASDFAPRESASQPHAQPDLSPIVPMIDGARFSPSQGVDTAYAAPAERAELSPSLEQLPQPRTVRQIALRIDNGGTDSAQVRLSQRGSEVVVTVRGSDQAVTESLRGNLSDLTARLEAHGVSADVWQPTTSSRPSDPHDRGARDTSRETQQDRAQSQNGHAGDGRRDRQSRPEWIEEEEVATQMPRRQSQ